MNNYSFNNQMKQLEIAEARKKMGTPQAGMSSQGLSNYSAGYNSTNSMATSLSSSTTVGAGEMQNARQEMNQSSYTTNTTNQTNSTTNYSATPSLSSSTAVGYEERQKAKQNMNTTSLS